MVDIYTVGPGDEVTKNGKPIVNKLVEARNEERIRGLSSNQLDDVFKFAKDNERFVAARKAIDKVAGSYDSGSVDEKGNTLSIDEKIEKVNKGDEFPYNIPIIGWICQKIEIAMLKSKKNKIKEEILNKIENGGLTEQEKTALGEQNVRALSNDKNLCNAIRGEIAKDEQNNKKTIEDYVPIVGAALNYAEKIGIIDNEKKGKIVGELSKDNVSLSTDKTLTEEQWKKLEAIVEQHKKEVQSKSQSTNVEQKQEQTKEANVAKPNPKALETDKAQQPQTAQTQVTPEVMQQKIGTQTNKDNGVQQAQTQKMQTQSKGTGLQIGNVGKTTQGTTVSSGATGVGTGQGKSGPQI